MQSIPLFNELRIPEPEEFKQLLLNINDKITFTDHKNNHWRIRIGKVTVNYYPKSLRRTIYVNEIPDIQHPINREAVEVKDCLLLVQELSKKHLN